MTNYGVLHHSVVYIFLFHHRQVLFKEQDGRTPDYSGFFVLWCGLQSFFVCLGFFFGLKVGLGFSVYMDVQTCELGSVQPVRWSTM